VSQKASRLFATLESGILRAVAEFFSRSFAVWQHGCQGSTTSPADHQAYLPAPLTYGYPGRLQYLIFAFWGSSTGASFCSDMGSFCSHPLYKTNDYRRPPPFAMIESCIYSSAVFVLPAVTLVL
jgi:hypothetical protein